MILAASGAVICLAVVHCCISTCDHDEIEHLHASWLVGDGAVPFRDFLEHHHPTLYYLYAPLTSWLDGSPRALVATGRIINLLLFLVMVVALEHFRTGRFRWKEVPWTAPILLGSWTFVRNALEVRPDPFMNLFCVLGLTSWLLFLRDARGGRALASGVCFAIATAFLQKAAVLCVLLALGSAALALRKHVPAPRIARGGLLLVSGAVVPAMAFVALIHAGGFWTEFVFWNYTFNHFYYLRSGTVSFSPWPTLAVAVAEDPIPWVLGVAASITAIRGFLRPTGIPTKPAHTLALVIIVAGLVASFVQSALPFSHNLLMVYPALALMAAGELEKIERTRWRNLSALLLLSMLAKVTVLCIVYNENKGHYTVQGWILRHTAPSETVYAPPPYHPIFRRDSSYFWFDGTKKPLAYETYCRAHSCTDDKLVAERRAWAEGPPLIVFAPPDEKDWWPFEWNLHSARYEPVPLIPGLYKLRR